jgi:ubiquinone/menaquinone biosynthesis C-methylase UbiE
LTPESVYIHGTHPEEQQRLSLLNRVLNPASLRELNLAGNERILDCGSGLGQFTRDMARAVVPDGWVLGIERSPEQIEQARLFARAAGEEQLVEFRQGDATQLRLRDEEWGSFDVAHCRFVLEHLRDPLAAVRELVRVVKPGGRVVLADDDHDVLRLHPEPGSFAILWRAYVRAFDRLGCDPFIGRRLPTLVHEAGAMPIRSTWIQFGACSGDPEFCDYVTNLIGVIEGARDLIVRESLMDGDQFDAGCAEIRVWSQRADAVIWYAMCYAEGRVSF